ncbi:FkbM family methyltransferase [Niastella caeni]|uniref:FkbM family methyltransferase n=1 Tax=Niastella caeni TaxID=2569763 RepID=A0A4S8I1X5_9BACT|nr:FkbM family methyltransferase [Niastella caeni]THU41731.1 FkbM family methyltransferase [Niastella caeni]
MVKNSFARYRNLFRHIRNWPDYFTRKFKKAFSTMEFTTRGNPVRFRVPSTGLYLVFKEIFVTDFYEIDTLVKQLPAKPVIVDIGANAGYFNIMLFSKIKDATVYAYEPISVNYELFKTNISLNPGMEKQVHLFNKAVTGTPQDSVELFMEHSGDNSVIASIYSDFDRQNKYSTKVPAISLQEIITGNGFNKIDLLKVDCEGSEYPIIYETPVALWAKVKRLTIEVHNLDDDTRNTDYLGKFLEKQGYEVESHFAHTNCYALNAVRK